MGPGFIIEPPAISIGQPSVGQKEVYELIPKVLEMVKHKLELRPRYLIQNKIECYLELTFDAKNPVFKVVVHYRNGILSRITLFGYNEVDKACIAFKKNREYQSDSNYYRKVTEAVNDVIENYQLRMQSSEKEKLFKCVIAICGQFTKTQLMPCRYCRQHIRNFEVPTVFSGLAMGNVSVAHPSCHQENVSQ